MKRGILSSGLNFVCLLFLLSGLHALAQKTIVGEHVPDKFETPHPYQGGATKLSMVHTDTITYPGGTYIAVHFASFELAEGDFVIVRSPDHSQSYEYSGLGRANLGRSPNGFFATHIKGDTAIVELWSKGNGGAFGYHIDFYGRGYNEKEIKEFWDAGLGEEMQLPEPRDLMNESLCTTDDSLEAKCYQGSEPDAYDTSRAVARLLLNGNAHCTGWLIGCEGHIMTNEHCIGTQSQANSIDFEFMAEGANCSTNCASSLACSGTIEASGGTLVAVDAALDYALVLPDTSIGGNTDLPGTYGYMRLRESGAVLGERLYIPQHPAGWGKRIAMETSFAQSQDGFARVVSLNEAACSGGTADVGYWADTQGGSSGSPVLGYSDNLVIALHHCRGSASCATGNSTDDPNRGVPIQDVITSLGANLPNCSTCTPPSVPGGTSAATNGNNRIDVSWNSVAGATYNVYRATGSCPQGSYSLVASGVGTTSYSDTNVSGGITYSYVVTAVAGGCESDQSACADATATGACVTAPTFAGLDSVTNLQGSACELRLDWSAL